MNYKSLITALVLLALSAGPAQASDMDWLDKFLLTSALLGQVGDYQTHMRNESVYGDLLRDRNTIMGDDPSRGEFTTYMVATAAGGAYFIPKIKNGLLRKLVLIGWVAVELHCIENNQELYDRRDRYDK